MPEASIHKDGHFCSGEGKVWAPFQLQMTAPPRDLSRSQDRCKGGLGALIPTSANERHLKGPSGGRRGKLTSLDWHPRGQYNIPRRRLGADPLTNFNLWLQCRRFASDLATTLASCTGTAFPS